MLIEVIEKLLKDRSTVRSNMLLHMHIFLKSLLVRLLFSST